jgi:hypothetical protein
VAIVIAAGWVSAQQPALPLQPLDPIGTGVLMISVDDPDQPYVRDLVEGFREGLDASPIPLVLYREFFDQIRFGDSPTYISEFRAWLHQKYRGRPLGAIVVTQQPILQLLAHAPDNPWNDVPIVYGTLGNLDRHPWESSNGVRRRDGELFPAAAASNQDSAARDTNHRRDPGGLCGRACARRLVGATNS